jgi:hypothetical protein
MKSAANIKHSIFLGIFPAKCGIAQQISDPLPKTLRDI